MATSVRVSIPITDEADDGSCTSGYRVRHRRTASDVWTTLIPAPVIQPIIIDHLTADTDYTVEIVRVCCDGLESTALTTTFTTPSA